MSNGQSRFVDSKSNEILLSEDAFSYVRSGKVEFSIPMSEIIGFYNPAANTRYTETHKILVGIPIYVAIITVWSLFAVPMNDIDSKPLGFISALGACALLVVGLFIVLPKIASYCGEKVGRWLLGSSVGIAVKNRMPIYFHLEYEEGQRLVSILSTLTHIQDCRDRYVVFISLR